MYWECRILQCCNGGPGIAADPFGDATARLHRDLFANHCIGGISPGAPWHIKVNWAHIIQHYSGRTLSCPEDKLTAVASVATAYHWQMGGPEMYLAGLWKSWIKEGLTWFVPCQDGIVKVRRRPKDYRAPSWSWASIDDSVYYAFIRHYAGVRDLCDFEVIHCTVDSAPLQRVVGGTLTLNAKMRNVVWSGDRSSLHRIDGSPVPMQIFPDARDDDYGSRDYLEVVCVQLSLNSGLILLCVKEDVYQRKGSYRCGNEMIEWFDQGERQSITII